MKRFTETTKWDDPWFLDLSPEAKLLWLYLCDKCDNSGVVDLHERKACFELGLDHIDCIDELRTRLSYLDNGKIHIESFISFQYGELKDSSNLHKSVIQLLKNHGLPNPSGTLQDVILMTPSKGKGKGTVKVNGKGKEYTPQFEAVWKEYGMKGSKKVSFERWQKLTEAEKEQAAKGLKPYLLETPEKQYRKDFERYLSQKVFEGVLEREEAGQLNVPTNKQAGEDIFAGVNWNQA